MNNGDKMFYCVGNWKMNKSPSEAAQFVAALAAEAKPEEQSNLVVLPPALCAAAVAEKMKSSKIRWGGQNCYIEAKGAFTGENSPQVFADLGAQFCLVGHSERRRLFFETDEVLAKKVKAVQESGMTPILCVGETIDDRKWRRTKEVVVRQLKNGLASVDPNKDFWLAYEPVWAIGTGVVAEPEQVEEAHSFLSETLVALFGAQRSPRVPILYGGSVKPDNSGGMRDLKGVNGFLIGGASLNASEFLGIFRSGK